MKHYHPPGEQPRFHSNLRHYHRSGAQEQRSWEDWVGASAGKSSPSGRRSAILAALAFALLAGGGITAWILWLS